MEMSKRNSSRILSHIGESKNMMILSWLKKTPGIFSYNHVLKIPFYTNQHFVQCDILQCYFDLSSCIGFPVTGSAINRVKNFVLQVMHWPHTGWKMIVT